MVTNRTSWSGIYFAYASLFLLGISDNIRGPLFPEMLSQLDLTNSKGSLFFSVASLVSILGSLSAPIFLDKLSYKWTLILSVSLLLLSQIIFYLTQDFNLILIGASLMGISFGLMGVVQNMLVIISAHANRLQQFQAGLHSMYGVSSLFAPLLVAFVFTYSPAWNMSFLVTGIFSIFFLISCLAVRFKEPNRHEVKNRDSKKIKKSEFVYFAMMLSSYVMCETMVSSRIAQFCRESYNFDLKQSSYFVSLFFISLLCGRVLFVFWRPQFSIKKQMQSCLVGTLLFLIFGLYIHPFFMSVSGFFMGPYYPLAMTMASKRFHSGLEILASICVSAASIMIVLMHSLVGALSDSFGSQVALLIGPFFLIVSLVLTSKDKYQFFSRLT